MLTIKRRRISTSGPARKYQRQCKRARGEWHIPTGARCMGIIGSLMPLVLLGVTIILVLALTTT